MSKFESVAIPFQSRRDSNRQYLTIRQVEDSRELGEFVIRFPQCFEYIAYLNILEFYPEGDAPTGL